MLSVKWMFVYIALYTAFFSCFWWVYIVWLPDAHQAVLSLPLFNRTQGESKMKRSWTEIKTLSSYHHRQTRLGEIIFSPTKQKSKHLPPAPPSQLLSFIPHSCTSFLPGGARDEEWGLWSAHKTSSLLHLSPHAVPLLQRGVSPMGTIFHKLLQCGSFPWVAVLQELLQCGLFPSSVVLWNSLELPVSDREAAPTLLSQRPPPQPPCCQNITT